jgi:hypothetical protein
MEDSESGLIEFFRPNEKVLSSAKQLLNKNKRICIEAGADFLPLFTNNDPAIELKNFFSNRGRH